MKNDEDHSFERDERLNQKHFGHNSDKLSGKSSGEINDNGYFVETDLKVRTYDIDVAGHVNNIVYIKWLEVLRTKFLKVNFDFPHIISEGFYAVVVSTSIKYRKQITLFDKPVGRMTLTGFNHGILTVHVEIFVNDQLSTSAEQKFVIMNLNNSKILKGNELKRFTNLLVVGG